MNRELALSRRTFLRGAGVCAALPFLQSLPRALGGEKDARPPIRMGIFTVAGGTVHESWVPKEAGPLGKLPSILRSLEPHKSEVLVLSNLSHAGKPIDVNAHMHCAFMHLTGADEVTQQNNAPISRLVVEGRRVPAISVDQRAAELVGEQSLLASLEIGHGGHGERAISFRRNGTSVGYEADPRQVFERMFKGRSLVAPNWKRRNARVASAAPAPATADTYDKQVVDLVVEDARRLSKGLAPADRHKLGEYLAAVEGIERRILRAQERLAIEALDLESPGPSRPARPNLPDNAKWDRLRKAIDHNPAAHAEYIRIMADLIVLAFQTDTTRVCSLSLGSDDALFPGVVTVGYEHHMHTLEHQGNANTIEQADPISREGCRQVHAWYTEGFTYLVDKMRGIDEGGSTLLDNSMLLYTSYMAHGGHGTHDYPVLLAGKAGGTLRTGRHIAFQKDTPVSNLYLEMLERMGEKSGEFGNSRTSKKAAYDGRLPGLS